MGRPEETPAPVPPRPFNVHSASTRDLIAELATTEDALRHPTCDPAQRRELAHTQALIVRELRARKKQWRREPPSEPHPGKQSPAQSG